MNEKEMSWFVWGETKLNELNMMTKSILYLLVIGLLIQTFAIILISLLPFVKTDFSTVFKIWGVYLGEMPGILFQNSELFNKINSAVLLANKKFINDFVFLFAITSPIYIFLFTKGLALLKSKSSNFGKSKYIRGSILLEEKELIQKAKLQPYTFEIGNIPIPIDAETYHFLGIGSSGAGKTQLLKKVIKKAKELNQKGVIHDIKGDWISEYYNPQKDLILNPMDKRTVKWNIWNDIKNVMDIKNFCNWIIADIGKDPFWQNSARMILESMMLYCYEKETMTNFALKQMLFMDGEQLSELLKGYGRGADFATKKDSFLTLQSQMAFIDFLEDGDFSIKEWVKNGSGFLFLSNTEETQALMKPVLSLAVQVVGSSILNLPDDRERRFYLFLDEFTSLHKLEKVLDLLKLGRSKGASVWLLFQDFQQLEKIYSREDRATVINNTGSIAVLRLKEADAALYFSKRFAKQEFLEKSTTISMGVAANRDGMSFNEQRKEDFIVKDSEILNLQPLEAYVMISFLDGVAKTKIEITKGEVINEPLEMIEMSKQDEIKLMRAASYQNIKNEHKQDKDSDLDDSIDRDNNSYEDELENY